jgi:hypothetical protein
MRARTVKPRVAGLADKTGWTEPRPGLWGLDRKRVVASDRFVEASTHLSCRFRTSGSLWPHFDDCAMEVLPAVCSVGAHVGRRVPKARWLASQWRAAWRSHDVSLSAGLS